MLYRTLAKWDDPAKTPALIFFAQLLEEMLFEFSLDTYKASVMHTGLLCMEALNTIREVEAGTIKQPNVHHVIAELATNFERDSVAIALSPLPPASFFPALRNPKTPNRELQVVLELLAVQLSAKRYRAKTEALILSTITTNGQLNEVRRLARAYVTTLTATGFSAKYLHDQTREFFHYGQGRLTSPQSISEFFALFPSERAEYTVIFRVDPVFEHVAPAFEKVRLQIGKTLPADLDLAPFPDVYRPAEGALYAVVSKIPARDPYSAREGAERLLRLSSTLMTLFHHKEHPRWQPESVVLDVKSGQYRQISMPTNSMHKCADLLQSVASKRLQLFMSDFSLDEDSFQKFVRSAQLHALAVASDADENQILNLWIALESLVPSETKSDDASNIEHIVASVVPFLNFGYIDRLVNNLVKDLLVWNQTVTRKALKGVPGSKFTDKLARVLVLPAYTAKSQLIEDSFKDFHLLRDRYSYFKATLQSPQTVLSALDAHKQRLEWQIRRIYRARNIIVHSGETPSYTKAIIEHTHDYLDTVLSLLVKLASKPKAINSVGQGFKYVELKYSRYYSTLQTKGLVFDDANIDSAIYCR
jgi:hypothetical protein